MHCICVFALNANAVFVFLAFLKTILDLGTARKRQLSTFAVAGRKVSRDYWSNTRTAAQVNN
jgi:hypothetical protein